jgi:peptidoglycan hydrolase-like protein with peptidoglycan-binding domain
MADGKYGKKTASQVAKFQASRGLKSDGICGQQTWKAIDEAIEPSPAPAKLFTVHIPLLTEEQCEELRKIYPDLWVTEK